MSRSRDSSKDTGHLRCLIIGPQELKSFMKTARVGFRTAQDVSLQPVPLWRNKERWCPAIPEEGSSLLPDIRLCFSMWQCKRLQNSQTRLFMCQVQSVYHYRTKQRYPAREAHSSDKDKISNCSLMMLRTDHYSSDTWRLCAPLFTYLFKNH